MAAAAVTTPLLTTSLAIAIRHSRFLEVSDRIAHILDDHLIYMLDFCFRTIGNNNNNSTMIGNNAAPNTQVCPHPKYYPTKYSVTNRSVELQELLSMIPFMQL